MTPFRRYILGSSATSLLIATLLLPWVWGVGVPHPSWAIGGWVTAVLGGTVAGVYLVPVHGRPGNAFLLRHAVGLGGRTVAYAGLAVIAWLYRGDEAVWSFVAGAGAGYLPTQAFELIWFARQTGRGAWPSAEEIPSGIGGER